MTQKNKTKRSFISALLIYIINLLVVLGYVLLLPFEKLIHYIKAFFSKFSFPSITLKFKKPKVFKKKKSKKDTKLKNKDAFKDLTIYKNSWIKNVLYFSFGVGFAIFFIVTPIVLYSWFTSLPQPELLVEQGSNQTTKFLDRNGNLLYEVYVDKRYNPIPLNEIPENVIDATLAIEDKAFYDHNGFRVSSIIRALIANMQSDDITQGASTITQQLVKNVLLTSERTYTRKIKELVLSLMVEQKYTKDEILELYLNNIPYGGTAYGIDAASEKFFGKTAKQLTLAEASMLAGLPNAPSVYSPLNGDPKRAKDRQSTVLNRMVEEGYITKEEAAEALAVTLNFVSQAEFIKAPHFVNLIRDDLNALYGKRTVDYGGLTVRTSLDLSLQNEVQQIVEEEVARNEYLNLSNGAAVVIEPSSGEILAYVGSKDYFSTDIDGKYDVARAYRQPGSSVKPYTYALALEQGYTPASIIPDVPTTFITPGSAPYTPKNYNGKFAGLVTFRHALSNSLNIPAVKLMEAVSPDSLILLGQQLGLTNWQLGNDYGLSLTLGGKEVRLVDHTNAFASFARQGVFKPYTGILSVRDINGIEMFEDSREEIQVLSSETSYLISHILSDNNARVPAFGYRSSLEIPGKTVAVKTGTTDSNRDNWTMGYTPDYMVGVWVGNNDNTPMNRYLSSGLTGAAPIWNRIMTTLLAEKENVEFVVPDGIFVKIDRSCGERIEVFDENSNIPTTLCPPKQPDDKDDDDKDSDDDD
jgi:1A family penicillin-binding protein